MPKNTEYALAELDTRWRAIFQRLVSGSEVPPAMRLRAEGFMEALVAMGAASQESLQTSLAACYSEYFSEPLDNDWRELFPFPQVPGFGQRAPVVPTTRD